MATKSIIINNSEFENNTYESDDHMEFVVNENSFYKQLNKNLDAFVKHKNFIVYWFSKLFFYSEDYKKNPAISEKKLSTKQLFIKLFIFLSWISLFICIIWGAALPMISSVMKTQALLKGNVTGEIIANNQLVGYILTTKTAANWLSSAISDPGANLQKLTDAGYVNWPTGIDSSGVYDMFGGTKIFYPPGSSGKGVNVANGMVLTLNSGARNYLLKILQQANPNLTASQIVLSVDQVGQKFIIGNIWQSYFSTASTLVPMILTLFFILVIFVLRYRKKKILPVTNKASWKDYFLSKVLWVRRFKSVVNTPIAKKILNYKENQRLVIKASYIKYSDMYDLLEFLNFMFGNLVELNISIIIDLEEQEIEQINKQIKTENWENVCITSI